MRVYKHVPAIYADSFASGESIAIGTFAHYRGTEGVREDRADPLEGSSALHIKECSLDFGHGRDDERQRQGLADMGIRVEPGARVYGVVLNSTNYFRLPPQYIFCASNNPDIERARLHDERIFEVKHIERFARLLTSARPDILKRFVHGKVTYENRVADPLKERRAPSSPFLKSLKFAFEDEYRIVWESGPIDGDFVVMNVPAASALITEIKF